MQVAGQTSAPAGHTGYQSQQHQAPQPAPSQPGNFTTQQLPQQPQLATQQQQQQQPLHMQSQQGVQQQHLPHHGLNGGWQSDKDVQERRKMIAKM